MVQALVFDCFGVLCVGIRDYVLSVCPEPNAQQLDELFDQADYGFVSSTEFAIQAAELLGVSLDAFVAMSNRQYHRDERMIALLRHLRASHKMGMLTNANDSIIRQLFRADELSELFDDVLISSEVGMIKPQPDLFIAAATRLNCLPEECVMIDDLASNIRGAEGVGMKGVVFTNYEQCVQQLKEFGIHA